jgi:dolichol-phosphate mannosyltransferase
MIARAPIQLIRRFVRFGLVGGSGVLLDMGILFLLADPRMLGWDLSISKCIAAEGAIISNFIWNDLWTFQDLATENKGCRLRVLRFLKFNAICLVGVGISVVLLNVQARALHFNIYLANFVAIFLASLWNFWMNLKFGWGNRPQKLTGLDVKMAIR